MRATKASTALADCIRTARISILNLTPPLFRRLLAAGGELDLSNVRALRIGADVVTIADVELFKARFPRGCTLEARLRVERDWRGVSDRHHPRHAGAGSARADGPAVPERRRLAAR